MSVRTIGGHVYRIGPSLAYQGKQDCDSPICTRMYGPEGFAPGCIGWHCSFCDESCSSQGHGCQATKAAIRAFEEEAVGEATQEA